MKHTYKECATKQGKKCNCNWNICRGGLCFCTVCYGAEGTLPTECPGNRISSQLQDAIYYGEVDYKDGQWQWK